MSAVPKGATIRRAKHDNKYFVMSRSTAQDDSLSFEALGMMTYLLSKPDDWEIRVDDLARQDGCNEKRIYRIINQLVDAGYMIPRKRIRNQDGTFGWTPYTLYERPKIQQIEPYPPNPQVDKPHMDKPLVDNGGSYSSTEGHSTDKQNTENKKTNTPLPPQPDMVSDSQDVGEDDEKDKSEQQRDPSELDAMVDAVKQLKAYGKTGKKVAKVLLGQLEGDSSDYNIDGEPFKPSDVSKFVTWWEKKYPDATIPRNMGSVQKWFNIWRDEQKKKPRKVEMKITEIEEPRTMVYMGIPKGDKSA